MPRKSRQSNAEVFIDLVAKLPWWVCLALAFAGWLIFRSIAGSPIPQSSGSQLGTGFFLGIWVRGLSMALQYVVPLLCLVAGIVSFARRKRRAELVSNITQSASADALNGMSWQEFELLVGEAFRLQGFDVEERGGARPDGGVDLVLRKGSEVFLVQCKQWKALKVGVDVVRELYGVMAARGAAGGFVVSSGRFTDDAVAFAAGRNVRLVDGPKLFGLLQQARSSRSAGAGAPAVAPSIAASKLSAETRSCPKCDSPMVRRTAKKGANAGSQFWGCAKFPACHGTRA